jgi:hypothetical protein
VIRKSRNILALIGAIWLFAACSSLPGGQAYESATVVYSAGSKKHTAAVQVSIAAPDVYASIVRLLEARQDLDFQSRNDKAMLIEVEKGSRSLTGQVTKLGPDRSLLYVWADAGESGITGEELAISVVELVCDELGVKYELVNY